MSEAGYSSNDSAVLFYLLFFLNEVEAVNLCNVCALLYYLMLYLNMLEADYCCNECAIFNKYSYF